MHKCEPRLCVLAEYHEVILFFTYHHYSDRGFNQFCTSIAPTYNLQILYFNVFLPKAVCLSFFTPGVVGCGQVLAYVGKGGQRWAGLDGSDRWDGDG